MLKRIGLARGNRGAAVLIATLAVVAYRPLPLAAQNKAAVTGVVKSASGEPMAGALIKIRSADSRLTFLVVSQAQGRYSTPELLPGKYTVQAFGGGYQSGASAPVEVNGKPGKRDIVMSAPQTVYPRPKKYTDAEFEALMPEGDAKKLLLTRCEICHSPGNFVARRKTRAEWKETVATMRYRMQENPQIMKEYNAKTGLNVATITDQEAETMADYLAKHYGPDKPPLIPSPRPDQHLPRTLLNGTEAKYFVMELNLGASMLVGAFAVDAQGNVWISEKKSGILGRLDPKTLSYTRVFTPPVNVSKEVFGTVAVDPKGHIWFTSNVIPNAQWFEYDPKSRKVVNTYDVPVPTTPGGDIFFNTLVFHPNGSIWATVTAYHRLVKLDPNTRTVSEYRLREGQHPFGITLGGDNNIWYSGDADNFIGKVEPATGKVTPFHLPTPQSGPRRLVADVEGNLWAATLAGGKLVKLDYRTGKMTQFVPPTAGGLQGVDVDRKQNLIWFSEYEAIKLGRFDPRTGSFAEFALTSGDQPPWITQVDPTHANRVWWNSRGGRIGYVELMD